MFFAILGTNNNLGLEIAAKYKEREWVNAVRDGDVDAFNQLFNRYGGGLYRFSYGYLKSKDEAEDVVQDVFMKIWDNRRNLNPDLSFSSYLFKIAFRHIHVLFQKIGRNRGFYHELIFDSIDQSANLDDLINFQSLLELVDQIIDHLPSRQKEILIKRRKTGLPIKEIAEELGISVKTVENHLTEALKTLKTKLGEEGKISGLLFFYIFYS